MKDLDGIPAFCRIPAEVRRAAWERNPPKPMPVFSDTGRTSNLTEHDLEVIAALLARDTAAQQKAREEGLQRLADHKARAAADKAEIAAVRDAAKEVVKTSKALKHVVSPARHTKVRKRTARRK